ncbi:lipase esterase [Fusarium phyllophilum]|uniref:Lipase esterase n=1 Tax=Fusarium phyllophilum TaxID=47803 RepID=A0A8H5MSL8_9HYPO|nr:lipase esterase [Fusarium phyllophilum]
MPFKFDPEYNAIMKSLFGNKTIPASLPVGDVEARRARMEPGIAILADPNFDLDHVTTRDFFADTTDGHKILLRWYSSKHKSLSPAVIYAHGGVAHSQEIGVDTSRIGIMGDSAGGGLAVAAALLARQNDGPRLAKVILFSPMLDDRTVTADEHLTPFLSWNTTDNETGWQALLGCSRGREMVTEIAAPARMVDATGMPPLYIEVGELDLFRNESIEFATKFYKAGISAELHVYPGCPHGFDIFPSRGTGVCKRAFENRDRVIKKHDNQGSQGPSAVPDAFTSSHVVSGCVINIIAGSDTTSISLSAVLYYLLKNPSCMDKLREEVDTFTANGQLSTFVTYKESQAMPYLQAVIKEALRLHPATGLPLERVVPKGGATISGRFFPEGAIVGINTWVAHRDRSIFGQDVDSFSPERWLQDDEERVVLMNRFWMPFGLGSRTCIGRHISMLEMCKLIPALV